MVARRRLTTARGCRCARRPAQWAISSAGREVEIVTAQLPSRNMKVTPASECWSPAKPCGGAHGRIHCQLHRPSHHHSDRGFSGYILGGAVVDAGRERQINDVRQQLPRLAEGRSALLLARGFPELHQQPHKAPNTARDSLKRKLDGLVELNRKGDLSMTRAPAIATAALVLAASASLLMTALTASAQGLRELLGDRAESRNDLRDLISDRSATRDDLRDLLRDRLERRSDLRDLILDRLATRDDLRDLLRDRLERRSDLRDLISDRAGGRDDLRDLVRDRLERRNDLRDLLSDRSISRDDLRDLLRDRLERRGDLRDLMLDRLATRDDLRDLLRDRMQRRND